MNLTQERGREKHRLEPGTQTKGRKQRDANTANKDFILPEPADDTLRLHRKAVEGLGRCQLTLVAKIADHLLFTSDKCGHEESRCLGETTEKGQIQGGGGQYRVSCGGPACPVMMNSMEFPLC